MKKRSTGGSGIFAILAVLILSIAAAPALGGDDFDFIEPAQSIVTPDTLDYTGAAITRIPIEVPPGRKGIQPNLALVYNSYAKNGWVGVGWDLGMGRIQRSTKRGVDYAKNDYTAVLNGATHELLPRSQWGANYYGAKIEKDFSKFYLRPDGNGWIVTRKDGTKYYYGETENARQQNENGVFKWYLSKIIDPNGNYLTATYHHIDGRLYLSQTVYTGHEGSGIRGGHWVDFILEARPDTWLNCQSRTETRTSRRLDKIVVYSNNQLFRIYDLTYDTSPASGRSRLTAVKTLGSDGITSLPPHKMAYEKGAAAAFDDYDVFNISSIPPGQIADTTIHLAEANGDGLTDVIFKSGRNLYYKYSNGVGSFTEDFADAYIPGVFLGFADVNGDGLADMIARKSYGSADELYVKLATGEKTYGQINYSGLRSVISDDARPYFSDVNGDGYTDVIFKVNARLYPHLSNGDGTFAAIDEIPRVTGEYLGFADVTGDGLADYVGLYAFRWLMVYPGRGDGTFGSVISSQIPAGEYSDTAKPYFSDINGDGLTDIVLKHFATLFVKLSNGDGTFRHTKIDSGVSGDIYGFADMTGDGFADVVRINFSDTSSTNNSITVNSTTGTKPIDLMTSYTGSTGAVTTLAYTQSTKCESTRVPFVMHPVSEITIDDGLDNVSTTAFAYKSGRFYPDDRAFHGFGLVTKTRPDNSTETTWYHVAEPYWKGRPSAIELADPAGGILTKKLFGWTKNLLSEDEKGPAFVSVYQEKTELDNNDGIFTRQNYDYDLTNGNVIEVTQSGSVGDTVKIETAYVNKGDWLWRLSRETLLNTDGGTVRETLYSYDNRGNLIAEIYQLDGQPSPVVTKTYDEYGNVWKVFDANGNPPTISEYDPIMHTLVSKVTNPLGHETYYQYDYQHNKVSEIIDANSNGTGYEYDPFGRLIQIDHPDGGQTRYEYNDCSDETCQEPLKPRYVLTRVKENDQGSYADICDYIDGLNRKIQKTSRSEGNKYIATRFLYDAMGRNYRTEGPFFSAAWGYPVSTPADMPYTQTDFDYRSRPVKTVSPLGESTVSANLAVTEMSYSGFDTTTTDPDGSTKTEQRDHLGRIVKIIEDAGNDDIETLYEYNEAGDLTKVVNHMGHKTLIDYDTLGRKTSMDDPDMGFWQYTYDANGNLKTQLDAKGQTISFNYDGLNRITKKSYSTSDPEVTYTYDHATVANGIGRLHKMSNAHAIKSIDEYDPMGRELMVSKTIANAGEPFTTHYSCDLTGKPTGMTYPDGHIVTYSYYPGTGLLKTVEGSNPDREYAVLEAYTPTGKIGGIYHGNQTDTRFTYDPKSTRLLAIKTVDQDLIKLQHRSYKYSAAGDIVKINDDMGKASYNYTYDKLHRLISETSTGAAESFKPVALTNSFNSAPAHAATSMAVNWKNMNFEYDANGNVTVGWDIADPDNVAKRQITYNADNMPVRIEYTKGKVTTIVNLFYDGEGKRVKKEIEGGRTTYYINEHFEVAGKNQIKYVFAGNLRIAKIKSGQPMFFHKDHLGSSTVMTDYNNGVALETAEYLPFGLMRNHVGEEVTYYKFTDQEFDGNIGLYNYDARLYDPEIARFISPDSIIPSNYSSQAFNRFAYCLNNPLKYIDPTGHFYHDPINSWDIDYGGPGGWVSPQSLTHDSRAQIIDKTDFVFGSLWGVGAGFATGNPALGILLGTGGIITSAVSRALIRDAAIQYVKNHGLDKPSNPEPDIFDIAFTGSSKTNAGGGTGPGGSAENLRGKEYDELTESLDSAKNNDESRTQGKEVEGNEKGRDSRGRSDFDR